MGGACGPGEVASQLVIAALAHLDDDEPGGDLLARLEPVRAGQLGYRSAQVEMEPDLEGMGTTPSPQLQPAATAWPGAYR